MTVEIRRASALFLVGTYTAVFVGLTAVYLLINYFFQIESAAMGVIIAICAAMTMARNWVTREQAAPSQGRGWAMSLLCAIVTLVLFLVLFSVGIAADEQVLREVQREGVGLLLGVGGILFVLNLLVIRLGVWVGTWQAVKQLPKA